FSATGYTVLALRWLLSGDRLPTAQSGRRRVGQPDVDTIREMTATFRRLDNQYGGGHVRQSVVRYLGNASLAVDLAQAAGRTARQAGIPVLVAEAAVMEA